MVKSSRKGTKKAVIKSREAKKRKQAEKRNFLWLDPAKRESAEQCE